MTYEQACKLAEKGRRVTREKLPRKVFLQTRAPYDVFNLHGVLSLVTVEDRYAEDWKLADR